MFLLFLIAGLTMEAFCVIQYKDIHSGVFSLDGQTGFARIYQTPEQQAQNHVSLVLDGVYAIYPDAEEPGLCSLAIKDIEGDGLDDFVVLPEDLGSVLGTSLYVLGARIYRSSWDNIYQSGVGLVKAVVYHPYNIHVFLPENGAISNYDKVFLRDFNNDGLFEVLFIGIDESQGFSELYWYMRDYEFTESGDSSTLLGHGVLNSPFLSSVEDVIPFHSEGYGYLLLQSLTLLCYL